MRILSVFVLITLLGSCSPTTQLTSSSGSYNEDLSPHRPNVPEVAIQSENKQSTTIESVPYIEPTEHIRTELDSVLRIKAARNAEIGHLKGFTIQVYSGRSREAANNAKNAVYSILVEEEAKVTYDQPMFRVKVGQYYSRIEAEKSYYLLRDKFPQALVLPERIPLPE